MRVHACAHTYMHTLTHTHMHTCKQSRQLSCCHSWGTTTLYACPRLPQTTIRSPDIRLYSFCFFAQDHPNVLDHLLCFCSILFRLRIGLKCEIRM
jgi:hypothetical protein